MHLTMKYNIFLLLALVLPISLVSQSTLIENITIVDVENGKTIPNQHILIQGETISKISSKKINTNENTNRINGKDNYIMPGMIDTHIHFFQTGSIYTRPDALDLTHINSYGKEIEFAKDIVTDSFKRYLRLGITSVMDLGGPFYNFKIRDSIAKNNISPNVYLTGPLFSPYQPKAFASLNDIPIEKINSIEEATTLFNKMLPYKPDFIKVWYIVQKDSPAEKNYELVKHIGNLAHQNNLKLAVHATQLQTAKFAIKAGADILVEIQRSIKP